MEFPTYAVLSIIEWKTYFYLFAIKPGDCELKLTKKRFRLLVSKIRCFQLYRTKNVSSVTASKKRFCLFAASHPNKNLISLNQHFVCFPLLPLSSALSFCEQRFVGKWRFPFLNAKIRCFQLHFTTNMCSLVFCKIALQFARL